MKMIAPDKSKRMIRPKPGHLIKHFLLLFSPLVVFLFLASFWYYSIEVSARLPEITCPTLLLRGAECILLTSQSAERIAREIPDCTLLPPNRTS